ncbi:molecular chaperone (small heat shock protein) [Schinkia azotoformans MEV2011]|uniref:Molecular chaperone (Small heat shock protein) n=1 Tax=Schinkia azotoformans MEV2011 TaxID=1348973 RepID=A0A072NXI3_SCHAZ|nr:Hsp20/alpha crystallin family protein [Schinkia azotoformans]KEF37950.1 molecular chaperone (small heat shock protein) [Schinkia azotoformans MEV2011]MEC1696308.1 Hsp20/alpha crystallin family protein [Schinkia azotoformans]MEC1717413.1 Hsp20/alpha crystallin family protein [Schinkia azotoformans]MEC1727266.1 Hsp20/alpha crystallin family protein [Schinkia azotoformans]MEC1740157.1 Hsp20/alpha crystallin family protein [Schinkia azotoformans]
MNKKKIMSSLGEASEFLGEEFWDVINDFLPLVNPRIDIIRTDKEMTIVAELPGIQSEEDLSIRMQGRLLVIAGEIKRPYIVDGQELIKDERFTGPFKRKIRLPEDCMIEKLTASYINGLLKIVIPVYSDEQNDPQHEIPVRFLENNHTTNN